MQWRNVGSLFPSQRKKIVKYGIPSADSFPTRDNPMQLKAFKTWTTGQAADGRINLPKAKRLAWGLAAERSEVQGIQPEPAKHLPAAPPRRLQVICTSSRLAQAADRWGSHIQITNTTVILAGHCVTQTAFSAPPAPKTSPVLQDRSTLLDHTTSQCFTSERRSISFHPHRNYWLTIENVNFHKGSMKLIDQTSSAIRHKH